MRIELSKESLQEIVNSSKNISQIARKCGLNGRGNSYKTVRKLVSFYEIDISKLVKNPNSTKPETTEKIKISRKSAYHHDENSLKNNFYIPSDSLRRIMKKIGIAEFCKECGISDQYNGDLFILQIDHVNGNKYDNRIENLRFLCPNCHSQTDTFGSKNKFDYSVFDESSRLGIKKEEAKVWPNVICNICQTSFPGRAGNPKHCSYKCAHIGTRKVELSAEEMLKVFEKNNRNFSKTSRELGISDNAIRKRLKKAGLLA